MKSITEKRNPNLTEKVKAYKEAVSLGKNALDTNAKNTKEYFETLKNILITNQNLSKEYIEYAKKEIDFYCIAYDKPTTEEQQKELLIKVSELNEKIEKYVEEARTDTKEVEVKAEKEAVNNKNYALTILKGLGIGLGVVLGAVALKESPDAIKKLIDKK